MKTGEWQEGGDRKGQVDGGREEDSVFSELATIISVNNYFQ